MSVMEPVLLDHGIFDNTVWPDEAYAKNNKKGYRAVFNKIRLANIDRQLEAIKKSVKDDGQPVWAKLTVEHGYTNVQKIGLVFRPENMPFKFRRAFTGRSGEFVDLLHGGNMDAVIQLDDAETRNLSWKVLVDKDPILQASINPIQGNPDWEHEVLTPKDMAPGPDLELEYPKESETRHVRAFPRDPDKPFDPPEREPIIAPRLDVDPAIGKPSMLQGSGTELGSPGGGEKPGEKEEEGTKGHKQEKKEKEEKDGKEEKDEKEKDGKKDQKEEKDQEEQLGEQQKAKKEKQEKEEEEKEGKERKGLSGPPGAAGPDTTAEEPGLYFVIQKGPTYDASVIPVVAPEPLPTGPDVDLEPVKELLRERFGYDDDEIAEIGKRLFIERRKVTTEPQASLETKHLRGARPGPDPRKAPLREIVELVTRSTDLAWLTFGLQFPTDEDTTSDVAAVAEA